MNLKIARLVSYLKKNRLDAFFVTNAFNIYYLTGYPAESACLLVCRNRTFYLTDSRYALEVKKYLKGISIRQCLATVPKELSSLAREFKLREIAIDNRLEAAQGFT